MRTIRNMLAGCVAVVAGSAFGGDCGPGCAADPCVEPSCAVETCFPTEGCEAPCVDEGCEAPCVVDEGCEAPCGGWEQVTGCEAPCGGCVDTSCVVPASCGCGTGGGCEAAYYTGCEAPCNGGCGSGCAEYGKGGWMAAQMSTMKYGWHGEAGYLCGSCGPCGGGCNGCGGYLAYKLRCIFGVSGGMTHSPGHGYVLPMRRPIYDVAHPYTHMWSRNGLGLGPQVSSTARTNVYMPTDTTQLGYNYGHVPYWQPRAGMVPAIPIPDAYHNRICVSDRCNGGACRYTDGGVAADGTVVAPQPTMATQPANDGEFSLPRLSRIPE